CPNRLSGGQCGMQAAAAATPRRRLRSRARLLVQGIDAASAAAQTETGADAGRFAPRMQADRQSAVMSKARSNVRFSPKSGHELSVLGCPLCANNGRRTAVWYSKRRLEGRTRITRIWVGIPTAITEPDTGFSGDGQPTWAYC